jgi:uncharacterized Rossmann fold enzyme
MRPALETTSVPLWATSTARPDADLSGRYWTVVAIGAEAEAVATDWAAQIAAYAPRADIRVHRVADDGAAQEALSADLVDAVVGWRLMIAGPAHACLRVRARALRCGVADDEITVATTAVAVRAVRCALCGTVTSAEMGLGDVLSCSGCGRSVVVHHHVSRRLGAHLGFLADAGDP